MAVSIDRYREFRAQILQAGTAGQQREFEGLTDLELAERQIEAGKEVFREDKVIPLLCDLARRIDSEGVLRRKLAARVSRERDRVNKGEPSDKVFNWEQIFSRVCADISIHEVFEEREVGQELEACKELFTHFQLNRPNALAGSRHNSTVRDWFLSAVEVRYHRQHGKIIRRDLEKCFASAFAQDRWPDSTMIEEQIKQTQVRVRVQQIGDVDQFHQLLRDLGHVGLTFEEVKDHDIICMTYVQQARFLKASIAKRYSDYIANKVYDRLLSRHAGGLLNWMRNKFYPERARLAEPIYLAASGRNAAENIGIDIKAAITAVGKENLERFKEECLPVINARTSAAIRELSLSDREIDQQVVKLGQFIENELVQKSRPSGAARASRRTEVPGAADPVKKPEDLAREHFIGQYAGLGNASKGPLSTGSPMEKDHPLSRGPISSVDLLEVYQLYPTPRLTHEGASIDNHLATQLQTSLKRLLTALYQYGRSAAEPEHSALDKSLLDRISSVKSDKQANKLLYESLREKHGSYVAKRVIARVLKRTRQNGLPFDEAGIEREAKAIRQDIASAKNNMAVLGPDDPALKQIVEESFLKSFDFNHPSLQQITDLLQILITSKTSSIEDKVRVLEDWLIWIDSGQYRRTGLRSLMPDGVTSADLLAGLIETRIERSRETAQQWFAIIIQSPVLLREFCFSARFPAKRVSQLKAYYKERLDSAVNKIQRAVPPTGQIGGARHVPGQELQLCAVAEMVLLQAEEDEAVSEAILHVESAVRTVRAFLPGFDVCYLLSELNFELESAIRSGDVQEVNSVTKNIFKIVDEMAASSSSSSRSTTPEQEEQVLAAAMKNLAPENKVELAKNIRDLLSRVSLRGILFRDTDYNRLTIIFRATKKVVDDHLG